LRGLVESHADVIPMLSQGNIMYLITHVLPSFHLSSKESSPPTEPTDHFVTISRLLGM
jgi:hypothetical protein